MQITEKLLLLILLSAGFHKKVKFNPEGTENKKPREVFETEEIERIKEMVCSHYENAGQIGKINEKLKFYKEHNNKECLCNEKGKIDEKKLARMRSSCICIRLGDADGHDYTTNETQGGRKIEIDEKTVNVDTHDIRKSRIEAKEQCASLEERRNLKTSLAQFEVRKMDIYEGGQKLTDENDESGIGRIYAVGEKNFKKLQRAC